MQLKTCENLTIEAFLFSFYLQIFNAGFYARNCKTNVTIPSVTVKSLLNQI